MNYFIHTGHLHIEGLKMSKSLKNFITIDVCTNEPLLSPLTRNVTGDSPKIQSAPTANSVSDAFVE